MPMKDWSPDSWKRLAAAQQPSYADPTEVDRATATLSRLPPLVTSWEVETLRGQLAEAADGKRFLLQGGDCAESFDDCNSEIIASKLKILLQMSLVLVHGSKKPVIRVGRFAGQYAKPRTDGPRDRRRRHAAGLPRRHRQPLPFTAEERRPDPGAACCAATSARR